VNRLKIGLLGAGYILDAHAKAIGSVDGVALHAVCDLSRPRAEKAARAHGIAHVLGSTAELAASDCDAVHVLLPPHLHASAARELLEAGKHVFLEKPMALRSDECRELAALARSRNLHLGVNHNFLFVPGYVRLRDALADGSLGTPDTVSVEWLFGLGLLQFGPFDNWILNSEGNVLFELGAHVAAFAMDLVGTPDTLLAQASHPIVLPGGQRVFRHWSAMGAKGSCALSMALSIAPGQQQRTVTLRGSAASARLDFAHDRFWIERTRDSNPLLDQFFVGRSAARQISADAWSNLVRYVRATLGGRPGTATFGESMANSVAAYYAGVRSGTQDKRLTAEFGADVIALCERFVAAAGAAPAAPPKALVTDDVPPVATPTVLVVGGTGFIGRRLVRALADRGLGVRVLSRGRTSARLALSGLPAEIVTGSHDDPATLATALEGIEVVYHLAKAEGKRWEDYVRHDIEPTRALAEAALRKGVRRFVYTGTIDSYASANAADTIDNATPLDPKIGSRNLYARSKAACEALLQRMHREQGLPLVILRPGIVIGAGSPPAHWGVGMFHSDTRADLWGDGTTKLPLVLVDDVADALARAADAPGIEGSTLLLTDAPLLSARDYVAEVSRASGAALAVRPMPIWRFFAIDAVKEALKKLIRHPNHRGASYHDWDCRSHRARYDSSGTTRALGWKPAGTREAVVEQGIVAAVRHYNA
jgi:predicted dehydrogenase/nucleoside-diphosphate-sugar epimerase